jgi:DNA-binding CsgD family transcriptional regulator
MPDYDADREAIIALIHRNRIAIWMRDYESWASCFVHAPYTARWGWWALGGPFFRQGWDDIASRLKREMSDFPEQYPRLAYETTVEDLTIRVDGDMAWATFEQHYPGIPVQNHGRGPALVYEVRFFERHEGQWKIAFLGMIDGPRGPDPALPQVVLDGDARVLSSPTDLAALLYDDDLVVRNGQLRIRDARANASLQAACRWAAGLDSSYMSYQGAVPIVMEAGEGLATKVWWIIAKGGLVLFSPGDAGVIEGRLDMAATIYGLSPAQTKVAALVADGQSLIEIAAELKITPNTARTHLNRIFEKTGVRNQTALVRVLLSAVSPL